MATAQLQETQVTPAPILEATFGFAANQILLSAIDLDLFTHLANGANTVETLARATSCSPRGLRILLNALVGFKYLERDGDSYALAPVAETFLLKTSPQYLGGMILHSRQVRPAWDRLTEIVHTGKPGHSVESNEDHGEFFAQFVDALYALNAGAAEAAAHALADGHAAGEFRVLDIGAGSGVWSLALARQIRSARVTVADWPIVIEKVTSKFAERLGVSNRYDYLPGNFREVDFGESRFDVALLGHICHSEGAERTRALFRRVHRALKSGGRILIAEMVADDARREAAFPLLFAVNMLVNTEDGDTFTFGEYRQWLEEAGFGKVRMIEAPSPSPLILAAKA
jgi:ubiquinone/menaquinone biosynthesis C-methylase UbiE